MQEFFMDYGLWLLIALLVIIGIVFLLSGRNRPAEPPAVEIRQPAAPVAAPAVAPPAPRVPQPVDVASVPAAPIMADPVAVAPAEPAAAPIPVSPAVTTPASAGDDLLKLKGVGPKLNALLIELGVTRYAQIAGWSDADIATVDAKLGNFKGRPVRDQWVDQAKYLAAGDIAGFEAKYGKV